MGDTDSDGSGRCCGSRGRPVRQGPERCARAVREWLSRLGAKTLFIEQGSPWENGYNESFNGKFRDELLHREIFYTVKVAKVLIEMWRRHENEVRPHSALKYPTPAPEAIAWPVNHKVPIGSHPIPRYPDKVRFESIPFLCNQTDIETRPGRTNRPVE